MENAAFLSNVMKKRREGREREGLHEEGCSDEETNEEKQRGEHRVPLDRNRARDGCRCLRRDHPESEGANNEHTGDFGTPRISRTLAALGIEGVKISQTEI